MPIYDYRCHECGKVSEFLLPNPSDGMTQACPDCGSRNMERLLSAASLLKNTTNAPGTTCCGREERCETPSCSTGEQCRRH